VNDPKVRLDDHGVPQGTVLETWLTPLQVCERVPAWTPDYLAQLRFRGTGPRFAKPSPRKVLYAISAIDEFLKASERTSTRQVS